MLLPCSGSFRYTDKLKCRHTFICFCVNSGLLGIHIGQGIATTIYASLSSACEKAVPEIFVTHIPMNQAWHIDIVLISYAHHHINKPLSISIISYNFVLIYLLTFLQFIYHKPINFKQNYLYHILLKNPNLTY